MNSQRDNACKSLAKVSFGYAPRFASMPRMTILIFAIFQVSGFDFCPKMETLSLRPLCDLMNFMDCTNISPGSTARISTGHVIDTMER